MKPKLIFFDMEGTLFKKASVDSQGNVAPSAWARIAEHLGDEVRLLDEQTKKKWNAGEYSGYVEWMEASLRIHKEHGLTKDFFEQVMFSIPYHEGVKEVFEVLREHGIRTALISGGFKAQADRAQYDLFIDHVFAACDYIWNEDGSVRHYNLLPCDYAGKKDFMQLIMDEHGLTPSDCAFVGDGVNDVFLAQAVATSICFNGAKELSDVCTHTVSQPEGEEDFRAILPLLGF